MVRGWVVFVPVVLLLPLACGGAEGGGDTTQEADVIEVPDQGPDICVPACADRECGDDGCGGECGSAIPFDVVCFEGRFCTPLCRGGIECGDDGCGGSCGTCGAGLACSFVGTCSTDPCAGVGAEGCCDGAVVVFCQGGRLNRRYCSTGAPACGWSPEFASYDCVASPSADPGGDFPRACADVCVPDCSGRACGDDGCGGSCGACGDGTVCEPVSGTCASCVPDCTGKACGDDGCGGSCGDCVGDLAYCAVGACQCTPQCVGRACGDDGCGGSCGDCEAGFSCNDGACTCAPQCDGKACGPDGCGNLCGVCDGGCACADNGTCAPPSGGVLENACDGTVSDPITGLVWQQAFGGSRTFQDARVLCDNLATAGYDDWRLPSVDELRSLIVGCPATASGGPCPIHDGCTSTACDGPDCAGCAANAGPGPGGAYLDVAFEADPQRSFWSVTQIDASEDPAFVVEFDQARVHWYVTSVTYMGVRCVRGNP